MVLVVAKKSRTFSSLPCSADEQVCRSWEGAEADSEAKLANGKILYHRCHAQVVKAGFAGGRNPSFIPNSLVSLLWVFELFREVGLFPRVWQATWILSVWRNW